MTHKGCVLQRVSLDALSDVTVVLGMRQSIVDVHQEATGYQCETYFLVSLVPRSFSSGTSLNGLMTNYT